MMAQRKEEHEESNLETVLRLVNQLTPEEQEKVADELELQWQRRAVAQAEKSVAEGRVLTEEQLWQRIEGKRQEIINRQKQ